MYKTILALSQFATKSGNKRLMALTKLLTAIIIVIDRFHLRNHKDPLCKHKFNMNLIPQLKGVNSSICEQTFRWLAGYKHVLKHMKRVRFNMFIVRLATLHNENLSRVIDQRINVDLEESAAPLAATTSTQTHSCSSSSSCRSNIHANPSDQSYNLLKRPVKFKEPNASALKKRRV